MVLCLCVLCRYLAVCEFYYWPQVLMKDGGDRGQRRLRRETRVSFKCFLKENNYWMTFWESCLVLSYVHPSMSTGCLYCLSDCPLHTRHVNCHLLKLNFIQLFVFYCDLSLYWWKTVSIQAAEKWNPSYQVPITDSVCVLFFWHFNISDDLMALFFVLKKEIYETNNSFALVGFSYRSAVG